MKPRYSYILLSMIFLFTVKCFIFLSPRILINRSKSLPQRFFLCVKSQKIERGSIVTFWKKGSLIPQYDLTKIVAGLPGDHITFQDGNIWVEGQMIGPLYPQTKAGEALTPLKSTIIPKGFVFLKGTHPFSLDSRYEEFGLVSVNDIQGCCWGFGRRA